MDNPHEHIPAHSANLSSQEWPRDTPPVIDHVFDSGGSGEWRKRKLKEAAQKYGRPFKCAGDEMPREVVRRGQIITVAERIPHV